MKIAYGIVGKDLTVNNITDYISNRKLLISSPGGSLYEGWAIHDFLKGKVDEIGVVGVCASAATIIMLAAPMRWGTPNSRYLIHNPWTSIEGDSKSMEQTALDLKIEQENLLKRYVECTGINHERLQELMNKSIYLTPDEALNINLIHNIKSEIMDLKKMEEKMNFLEKTIFALKKFFVKNIVVQDVNGKELDFGEQITDNSQIDIGMSATVEGSPAEGKYVMPDGTTLVFEAGKITEIIPASGELEAIKKELESEKKQNMELKNKLILLVKENSDIKNSYENKINKLAEEFSAFKNEFSQGKTSVNTPTITEPVKKRISILL
jgi:ATP-dependent Clp protease, protease subunit